MMDDVISWLHQASFYILIPSSEGLALSMLEGLKTGLPVIVPNVRDLSDALIENHSLANFSQQI